MGARPHPAVAADDRDKVARELADRIAALSRPSAPAPAEEPSDESAAGARAEPAGGARAAARQIVLRQLAVAPRSRAELAAKLKAAEIPDDIAGQVLDAGERSGLVDDATYAANFVRAKHRDRGLGRTALRAELRRRGVADEQIVDAVSAIDDDAELRRATDLARRRAGGVLAAGPVAARRRLLAQLARRGYSPSVAARAVSAALGSADADESASGADGAT